MSGLPSKPSLDLSLPSRPSTSAAKASAAPKSLARISSAPHGLPPKPVAVAPPPRSTYSPPPRDQSYEASSSSYYRPRSPSPRRSDWDRLDTYLPPSPRRADWDRSDTYVARASSPPLRTRDSYNTRDSAQPSRQHTDSYISRPSPSPSPPRQPQRRQSARGRDSLSPIRYARSPSPSGPRSYHTGSRREAEYVDRRDSRPRRDNSDSRSARVVKDPPRNGRDGLDEDAWAAYREAQKAKAASAEERKRELETIATKREAEAQQNSSLPPIKRHKSIPTGPRQTSFSTRSIPGTPTGPRIPTGPAAHRPIPTGPRAESSRAYTSQHGAALQLELPDDFHELAEDKADPSDSDAASGYSSSEELEYGETRVDGQIMELHYTGKYLKETFGTSEVMTEQVQQCAKLILSQLLNPSPVLQDTRYPTFHRVSIVADEEEGIIGIGDHPEKKRAARLACLSALHQLAKTGILEKKYAKIFAEVTAFIKANPSGLSKKSPVVLPAASKEPISQPKPKPTEAVVSSKKVKISDGTEIDYARAREFMEYYCKRFKFGKPDFQFSEVSTKSKTGKMSSKWEAVIIVGGRTIGMGTGKKKSDAQIQCFLDVAQYLESCDQLLWQDFLDYSEGNNRDKTEADLTPPLLFQISETVNNDIFSLCGDIRESSLGSNGPSNGSAEEARTPRNLDLALFRPTDDKLSEKSSALREKLQRFHTDPETEQIRALRSALPLAAKADHILATVKENDVTIVLAATGSGKTTQIPQMILDDYIMRGEGAMCNVLCTQPRRIAALSVAQRVAEERNSDVGEEVGYQLRFKSRLPKPNGSILFCTTGIFLRILQHVLRGDAYPSQVAQLNRLTHIIVDEVHERDVDIDLTLSVLKELLARRKAQGNPLKIILMSATIDPALFQSYFADESGRPAPVVDVEGRSFLVKRHFLNDILPSIRNEKAPEPEWVWKDNSIVSYLDHEIQPTTALGPDTGVDRDIPIPLLAAIISHVVQTSDDGHILVFVSGWKDIRVLSEMLLNDRGNTPLDTKFNDPSRFSLHYLHSSIPPEEQREVFRPAAPGIRRIILATNIAETSVTIPDTTFVVDAGRVKEDRFDPDRRMSSIVNGWVSVNSLNQRAGRAGRHREGEYFSLLSRERLAVLAPNRLVEIQRADLSGVVMRVKALDIGRVEDVLAATIEPPEAARVTSATQSLRSLGALDEQDDLTSLGLALLHIPADPSIGKLCLYGILFRCLEPALILGAILHSPSPWTVLSVDDNTGEAAKKARWSPSGFPSDILATLSAYNAWVELENRGDWNGASEFCRVHGLNKRALLNIKQVKESFCKNLHTSGLIAAMTAGNRSRSRDACDVPPQLNAHGESIPLMAALVALASAPNFAIRKNKTILRTSQDKVTYISGVNSKDFEGTAPDTPSPSHHPAEKRLYAFSEKTRVTRPGQSEKGTTLLRDTTRLDPLTYMLFGAHKLAVTSRGLECDSWLNVIGNLAALDDIQRLRTLLDKCMLRVFEGVAKSMSIRHAEQSGIRQKEVIVQRGISRIKAKAENAGESDDGEGEDGEDPELEKRKVEPLSHEEIIELELLTTDVVKILEAYAEERAIRPESPSGENEIE